MTSDDVVFFGFHAYSCRCGLQFSNATFWEHPQKKVKGIECFLKIKVVVVLATTFTKTKLLSSKKRAEIGLLFCSNFPFFPAFFWSARFLLRFPCPPMCRSHFLQRLRFVTSMPSSFQIPYFFCFRTSSSFALVSVTFSSGENLFPVSFSSVPHEFMGLTVILAFSYFS